MQKEKKEIHRPVFGYFRKRLIQKFHVVVASFNSCLSLPSVSTNGKKQFQCLNIVINNKTGPLFLEYNLRKILVLGFKQCSK